MKNLLLSALTLLATIQATAQAFITTWKTDNPGTSGSTQITIPTTGFGYNYNIYWEEVGNAAHNGNVNNVMGSHTIEFGTAGTYRVEITGAFPRIFFNFGGDKSKILTVTQWGNIAWTSMNSAFSGCNNLTIPAQDAPNLSNVTDVSFMFAGATSFNQPIGHWNMLSVTNMQGMFSGATNFNQSLDTWNVISVTNMTGMFSGASSFNAPIGNWFPLSVTNMNSMFSNATAFNQPLNSWNVGSVTNMGGMFSNATTFNQPLNSWNVGSVTNMLSMFSGATSFNQPLNSWNVGSVTNMLSMFSGATSFNQPLNSWNVGSVTNMGGMFSGAIAFNQPLNSWNVSNVTNMSFMFYNPIDTPSEFNQPLNSWNVSNVTNMSFMFASHYHNRVKFNQSLNGWIVSKVIYMSNMFQNNIVFNQPIDNWDVGNVTNMDMMFYQSWGFNQPLDNWNVSNVTSMSRMFTRATAFNQPLNSWNVSKVTNMSELFSGTAFNQPLNNWDVSGVTDMSYMFSCKVFNQPLNSWDVGSVTNMNSMFASATSFNQPIGNWNVGNVTNMGSMFFDATSFNQPLDGWNVSNVTNMSYMFFTNFISAFNQPLNNWDVSNVANMSYMFKQAYVFNQPLNSWNVSNVTNMTDMFSNSKLSSGNYDVTLQSWAAQNLQQGVALGASGLKYCAGEAARNTLVNTYGWVISGDSKDCTQTITFQYIPNKVVGDPDFDLIVTSSSELPVTLSNSNDNVATLSGKVVTIKGKGTTTITASQAGNAYYGAATAVQQVLTVKLYNQTITFSALPAKIYKDVPFALTATASSGLPVTYSSSNSSVAILSGNTVTITGAGTTTITARQTGNDDYHSASAVNQVLTVNKAEQTITFSALPERSTLDAPFTLTATASSGLPTSYTSSNTNVATVSGNTVTIKGVGTTTITASQAGNVNYNPAAPVDQVLTVKLGQIITFNPLATKTIGDAAFTINATTSSGLPVTFSVVTTNLTINGNTVTITGAGKATVRATQVGDANYAAATAVEQTFCVNPAKPTITLSLSNPEAPVLTSSASGGNQWFKNGTAINTAVNNTYTVTAAGSYTVVATVETCSSQPSDAEVMVVTEVEQPGSSTVSIYPNPVHDVLTVDVPVSSGVTEVTLYDFSGRAAAGAMGTRQIALNVQALAQGMYIVRIKNEKQVITQLINKQ